MSAARDTPSRRARIVLSSALAAMLALGAGVGIVLAGAAQPAHAAPGDVTNDTPENTPITHSPFLFQGTASPGDAITVSSYNGLGPDCHTVADPGGDWTCNVFFDDSADLTVVTATRDVDDNDPATQESEGWEYPVALPVSVDENVPGGILTRFPADPITGSGAWPTATMIVTVGGLNATCGPADGSGNWSCTPPALPNGSHAIVARQDVGGATSDPTNSTYTLDTVAPPMPTSTQPYDSTAAPANAQTSDQTPAFGGPAGSAEPGSTTHVLADDRGTTPIAHPAVQAFSPYCTAVVAGDGSWSCTGAAMTVGHFYEVSLYSSDPAGNVGPSPDDEFGVEILPPPDAPVVFTPTDGFGELPNIRAFGSNDIKTTEIHVYEDGTDLCGAIIPAATSWNINTASCPGGIDVPPGTHTFDFIAYDVYGTPSDMTTVANVEAWGQPTIVTPANGSSTSAATVHVTGYAPTGSDLQVRLNSNPICNVVPAGDAYDCVTPLLAVPFGHALEVDYTDPWGDPSGTTTSGFTTVPTLPAPVFVTPTLGYESSDRTVHVSTTNAAEGTMFVREGLFNLCAPKTLNVATFSCTTSQLPVGTHTITISQTDQYGVMSASAQRVVTILPTPDLPLTMKTFGFTIQILNEVGEEIGDEGVGTGDIVTIVASNVPPGTKVEAEIHSDPIALGGMTIGQTGQLMMRSTVPPVPPGQHEIVVGATAPGYWPGTATSSLAVHGLKVITDPADEIKQLGEPATDEPQKQVGVPHGPGNPGPSTPGSSAHGFTDPSVFGSALASPYDAAAHAFALTTAGIVLSGSIAIVFLLFVGFPAELLESTIRSNYDRAFGWIGRLRRRVHRMLEPLAKALSNQWVATGLSVLAASFVLGFADPDFGFNGASVRLFLAMIISVLTINVGLSLIVMRVAKRSFDVSAVLKPMPAAIAIVAISVLVSRLLGISPGFLFGVVLGVAYARELKLRDEARLGVLGVGLTIAAGVLAWLGYGLASLASGPGFFNNLLIEALAAITLEALGTLVIAMLPIEFLDGKTIFRWSKLAWLGLYAVTLLVFLFVVVPLSDNWGVMSAPILGWGTLFVVFAVVAVATWAIFQRRTRPSSPAAEAPRRRVRR